MSMTFRLSSGHLPSRISHLGRAFSLQHYTCTEKIKSQFLCVKLKGRTIFIKRDDLFFKHGVNGNKARKLHHFGSLNPFPLHVYSIGGIQSNSMLAIAKIVAQHTGSQFHYITKPIPNFLKNNPTGNYATALSLGMQTMEATANEYQELFAMQHTDVLNTHQSLINHLMRGTSSTVKEQILSVDATHMWIPQGGASVEAREGLELLGAEIELFLSDRDTLKTERIDTKERKQCQIFVESGTGTTALFLHQYFQRKAQCRGRDDNNSSDVDGAHGCDVDSESVSVIGCACDPISTWDVSVTAVSCVMPPAALLRNMEIILSNTGTSFNNLSTQISRINERITTACDHHFPSILFLSSHERNGSSTISEKKKSLEQQEERFLPFGTPQASHLDIWKYLQSKTGVEFDLLYAPKAFEQIFRHWEQQKLSRQSCNSGHNSDTGIYDKSSVEDEEENEEDTLVVYVHCGGVEGNISQWNRYKYLNLINPNENMFDKQTSSN